MKVKVKQPFFADRLYLRGEIIETKVMDPALMEIIQEDRKGVARKGKTDVKDHD